jgi:FkbM family methyltransferase
MVAAACAETIWRLPFLERPFVAAGRVACEWPGVGRFYRSTASRLGVRMRQTGSPFRQVGLGDFRFVLDVSEFTAGPLYFCGTPYEPQTVECFVRTLGPGHVFVDVGANHGYFTMLAAFLVGDTGRVVAFEPNPKVFRQLQVHAALNHVEARVSLLPLALAESPGEARLYLSQEDSNTGLSSLAPGAEALALGSLSEADTIIVQLNTFDRWLASSGLDHVDLVKIDVEGSESRVLAGMSASLAAGMVDAIVCETEWDGPFHRTLCAAGFSANRLDSVGTLTNIIFTSRSALARSH